MTDATDLEKQRTIEELYARSKRRFPDLPDVTAEELLARPDRDGVVLVDVRTPREQEVSMIPGAVTAEEFEAEADRHRGATVVTYCTLGHRSGIYGRQLARAGWHVKNLKGSILSWTHAGGELQGPDGPTRRVHVGGPKWSLAAGSYEPVW